MSTDLPRATITTDGSCYPNDGTGHGGWAAVIREAGKEPRVLSGGLLRPSSNNRAEFTAVLEGLRALGPDRHEVTVRTDSQYVMNSLVTWRHGWAQRGWITASKEPVKNRDLIEAIAPLLDQHKVDFVFIRGHSGDEDNELCDRLAMEARQALARGVSV